MKPLVKLFLLFCLVGIVLSRPMPEDEEPVAEGGDEETTDDAGGDGGEEENEGEEHAGDEDAGGEDTGKEENTGHEDAGEEDAGEEDAGEEDAEKEEGEKEDAGDDAGSDDGEEDSTGGDEGEANAEDSKGSEKNDPADTYRQVVALLDKDTKVDHIQSEYLRSALNNDLQSEVRVPVVEAIGRIGDYSKIQGCFKSMGKDVKKVISEEEKKFKSCMSKKKSEYQCSEDSFAAAKSKLSPITSKIKSCVSSKGR
ncbi:30 kDa salivary gland allergen Aed a 3 [Aedes aegypti]|uniref:Aegyptin/gSG7 salivary protein-like four-helix bundle domain-containing protein n=1 Tax=Aedes aegypti TaxID=7159 RepID=A0A903UL49_AEDAE|nr:30 kDa salivary gland allergen Aed a 3 [Aedes aegypti]AAB58417.1 30 kDa salivary gland allergen Aed a 3 [Aedes aegypti]